MDRRLNSQIRLFESEQSEGEARHKLKFAVELNYRNAGDVVEAVRDALSPKPGSVSIDLAAVPLIDSSGLRALLQAKKMCEDANVDFRLHAISDAAARVVMMSGLGQAFGLSDAPRIRRLAVDGRRSDEGVSPHGARPTAIGGEPLEPDHTNDDLQVIGEHWNTYEYIARSDPSVIADLRERATSVSRQAGASGDTLCDIQIAVGEALTNAYRHGSRNKPESKICMTCMTCPKAFVVEITDEGDGFDIDSIVEPDPNQMLPHGMGIYLMRQAMDVVEFRCGCHGTCVRMVKWLQ